MKEKKKIKIHLKISEGLMKNPNKPTFERFSTFEELKGIKKPNQALQYDSGKYYYIKDCPKKPCKDKCESSSYCLDNCEKEYVWNDQIKSARIEVAPESLVFANQIIGNSLDIEPVNKKLTSSDYWVFEFPEGIYPVQVKVRIIMRYKNFNPANHGHHVKQYAILSEPDKDTITP